MSNLKSQLSKRNPYYISRNRYYELKHFCLQYPEWQEQIKMVQFGGGHGLYVSIENAISTDPTAEHTIRMENVSKNAEIVNKALSYLEPSIRDYIHAGVVYGKSYDILSVRNVLPCSRERYYEEYRKFFYILDKLRG